MSGTSSIPDLHDAVLDEVGIEWALGACTAHLRGVGPSGGVPVEIRWQGVTAFAATRVAPWGPSNSVLELATGSDGQDELRLQSGDVIRVRADRRHVNDSAHSVAARHAALVVDALVDAGLVPRAVVGRAIEIATTELQVRRAMGDL